MILDFYKFHGAGNDFIIADNRQKIYSQAGIDQQKLIAGLCHRRFGIGADGLILLEDDPGYDFRMVYFNSNGLEGSMCGNGGRCIVAFAHMLGIIKHDATFIAIDGIHQARILDSDNNSWSISLKMTDSSLPEATERWHEVNTGSPHVVVFNENISALDVVSLGRQIRNSPEYAPEGINVNFVQILDNSDLLIRTYERGVEDETFACGTGAVAAAIAAYSSGLHNEKNSYMIKAKGGILKVSFSAGRNDENLLHDIFLSGPVQKVFVAQVNINELTFPDELS